jgi:hypothetical protein
LRKCGSHVAGNGLIGDRERDASSRENSPRAYSPLLPASFASRFAIQALKKFCGRCALKRLPTLKEKSMRKSVIRLVLMTMLIAGVSSVCRATGPLPPMIPPTAAK